MHFLGDIGVLECRMSDLYSQDRKFLGITGNPAWAADIHMLCSVSLQAFGISSVWVLDPFWAWIIDFTKQGQKDWIQAIFKTNAAHISSCNIKFTIMWMFLQPLCVSCLFHSMPAHPMYEFGREKKCNFTCHLGKVTLVIFYCLAFWALEEKHQEVYPCQRIWPLVDWETQCAVSVLNQLLHCLSYLFKCPPA